MVDEINTEVILSGFFEFHALVENVPVTDSNGRFDVRIDGGNFFRY
jgi:hypothetical protein